MNEEKIISLSQKAYGICIICMGIQQLAYGDISPNFLPLAFSKNFFYRLLAYPWGIAFTLSGVAIVFNKKAFEACLISAGIFLSCFIFVYAPYLAFFSGVGHVFLQWAPAFQALSFTGASLIAAESFRGNGSTSSPVIKQLEKLIPFSGIFFSAMLIGFGLDHFLYIKLVAGMVPSWIPYHEFWTYLTGTALVGAGVSIIFKIKVRVVASLLGIMIFSWLILLHIPRAINNSVVAHGLELTRCFVTFGFTGISFLFAFSKR